MADRLKRALITEELFTLTKDSLSALILHQFLYWSVRTKDIDTYITEERLRQHEPKAELTRGWIYKKAAEMKAEIMADCSQDTIRRRIINLVDAGWLAERRNPKYKWDRTLQYRPNLYGIENDLRKLGYTLATLLGRYYPMMFGEGTLPADTEPHHAASRPHHAAAIPETTPETTTEMEDRLSVDNLPLVESPAISELSPKQPTPIEEGSAEDKAPHGAFFTALKTVCKMDSRLSSNRGRLNRTAKEIRDSVGYTPEDILELYSPGGWWYESDFRKEARPPPKPEDIPRTLLQAMEAEKEDEAWAPPMPRGYIHPFTGKVVEVGESSEESGRPTAE